MNHVGNWVLGFFTAAFAVGGLFVAARGGEGVSYWGGLGFFVFAVLFVFLLIRVSYDKRHS
jgi:hypothetical protein